MRLGPLAARPFRLLFFGRTVSLLGSAIAPIALAFAVLGISRSPAVLGLVVSARLIPTVLLALVGGVWADRLPRQLVMTGTQLLSGAAQAATAALLLLGQAQIWQLVVLQMIGGAASAFFLPALSGLVPQTVAAPQRQRANALLSLSASSSRVLGAALGGLLARIGVEPAAPRRRPGFAHELAEGWSEFRAHPWLWASCGQFAVVNALGVASILVLGPVVARDVYGGATAWGLIQASLAIGFVLGGLIAFRISVRRPLLSGTLAGATITPALLLFAVQAPPAVVAAAMLAVGMTASLFETLFTTELQRRIPEERLSRVMAYELLASLAFVPIGAPAVGAVASTLGIQVTLCLSACIVLAVSLAPLGLKDIRRPQREIVAAAEPVPAPG
jgi:MFS family permease